MRKRFRRRQEHRLLSKIKGAPTFDHSPRNPVPPHSPRLCVLCVTILALMVVMLLVVGGAAANGGDGGNSCRRAE